MNTSSGKLHFWDLTPPPLMYFSGLAVSFCQGGGEGGKRQYKKEQKKGKKQNRVTAVMSHSPVTWSTRMREVMMRPC